MRRKKQHIITTIGMTLTLCLSATGWAADAAPSGESLDVRATAILAERCYTCHSAEEQEGGLRLDSMALALEGGDSGEAAFIAGDADESFLIYLITSDDPDERMPEKEDALPPKEIETLRAWIAAGAKWPGGVAAPKQVTSDHWAFTVPERSAPPTVQGVDWARNPIDNFLLARMAAEGLQPNAEADRYTLIRRASLELTGLPPTPTEIEAFVNDSRPDAYERLVDRLMATPQYGERQARRWLDIARYGDTNGYEKDRRRSIWPYRDWVIDAYNRDLPYDRFIVEQLAGDLLPNATQDQRIATGFHRNTMFNEEGGIDAMEDRYKRDVDRVNTTGAAFLGLTMSCAQCHTHKFDPITQREYFSMLSFFHNAAEDTLPIADPNIAERRNQTEQQLQELEDELVRRTNSDSAIQEEYQTWRNGVGERAVHWDVQRPVKLLSAKDATLVVLDDASVLATEDIPNDDTYEIDLRVDDGPVTAIRLEALPHETLPGGGPGRGTILDNGDFLLSGIEAEWAPWGEDTWADATIASASESFATKNRSAAESLDGKADTGWSVKGETGRAHAAVFAFAQPIEQPARLRVRLRMNYIHQHTLGRFRISTTSTLGDIQASGVAAELEESLLSENADDKGLQRFFALHVSETLKEDREIWKKKKGSVPKLKTTLVMTARDAPRPTVIRHRGEFLSPRGAVSPGVPGVLPPLPKHAPRNRLTLAHWIAGRDNPLTARVAMNRLWQYVFGVGLVTTPEDFGTRGARPTHPELLDFLAVEFMDRGWNWKDLHRMLVTSAAFRQSSEVLPDALQGDPENVYLARAPRFRLDAEVIRDTSLAAAGLLNSKIGGPSVYPPQPDGVTQLAYGGPGWPTSRGENRYRRGMYTYWKRTAPYAISVLLDAPTGDEACVRRRRTNTPLQALSLLNGPAQMEAAQGLANRILEEASPNTSDRVRLLYLLTLNRQPDDVELERFSAAVDGWHAEYVSDSLGALKTAGPRGWLGPKRKAELAAWTLAARAILNVDEMVTQE